MPADMGMTPADWDRLSSDQRTHMHTDYQQLKKVRVQQVLRKPVQGQELLEVRVEGGRAMMPPFDHTAPYHAAMVQVPLHACRVMSLRSVPSDEKQVRLHEVDVHVRLLDIS